jgi:predicted ArsR family transcriptional regulator
MTSNAQSISPNPKNTRHAIMDILKREGPQDAGTLARRLSVTPMAIGLQLASLEEEKVVVSEAEVSREPRRGRPVRLWHLTEAANRAFPDAHALLTVGLLSSLQEVFGKQGIEKLLEVRTRQNVDEYSRAIPEGVGLRDKVKALALIRDREGYMTEVKPATGGGFLLIENHCPICTAAKTCQGICQSEWQVFQSLMGTDVQVVREEHLLSGDRRCVYSIRPTANAEKSSKAKSIGGG